MNNITELSRSNGAAEVSASQDVNVFECTLPCGLFTSPVFCKVVTNYKVLKKDLFHSHGGML